MAKKMTKTQLKRKLEAIHQKALDVYIQDPRIISFNDMDKLQKLVVRAMNKIK